MKHLKTYENNQYRHLPMMEYYEIFKNNKDQFKHEYTDWLSFGIIISEILKEKYVKFIGSFENPDDGEPKYLKEYSGKVEKLILSDYTKSEIKLYGEIWMHFDKNSIWVKGGKGIEEEKFDLVLQTGKYNI